MTTEKIEPVKPGSLDPSTTAGRRMAHLAGIVGNTFSDYDRPERVVPAAVISRVFAKGSSAENGRTKMDNVYPRNLRAGSVTVLATCIVGAVLAPPLALALIPGVITAAIIEKSRYTMKRKIKAIDEKSPKAEEIMNEMIGRLEEITAQHAEKQTPQSQKELRESLRGFVSIFSDGMGFSDNIFDGRSYDNRDPGTEDSPMIKRMDDALSKAFGSLETVGTDGPPRQPGGRTPEAIGNDVSRDQTTRPNLLPGQPSRSPIAGFGMER